MDYIQVIPIDLNVIKKGLKSKHKDFEDAIQMLCAYSIEKMDCIVTRNIKDFRDCEIPVFSPRRIGEKTLVDTPWCASNVSNQHKMYRRIRIFA